MNPIRSFTKLRVRMLKVGNEYHSDIEPAIKTPTGEWWYLNGRLHRGGGKPAIITKYSERYYWKGICIPKSVAQKTISAEEILKLENMEIKQAAIEIIGYEKFLSLLNAKEIDRFSPDGFEQKFPQQTNPMYILWEILFDDKTNPVKILQMNDPNKKDTRYFIRVHPNEKECKTALAHSYGFETFEEYISNQNWEGGEYDGKGKFIKNERCVREIQRTTDSNPVRKILVRWGGVRGRG